MKRAALLAAGALLAGTAWGAEYVVVDPAGGTRIYGAPPLDLTYPPSGMRAPLVDKSRGEISRGRILTAAEARARQNAPMLIIIVDPPPKISNRGSFERADGARGVGVTGLADNTAAPRPASSGGY